MPKTIEGLEEELNTVRGQLKDANAKLDQSAEDLAHAVKDKDLAVELVGLYEEAEREELEELVHSILPDYDCEGKENDILRNTVDTHLETMKMVEAEKEEKIEKEKKEELAHSEESSVGKTEPPSTGDGTPTPDRFSSMLDG